MAPQNIRHSYLLSDRLLGEKVSPTESYVDGMDGTVVIASESNMLNSKETLHISLQGSGSDLKKDIHDSGIQMLFLILIQLHLEVI
jgi:hypothetical protein